MQHEVIQPSWTHGDAPPPGPEGPGFRRSSSLVTPLQILGAILLGFVVAAGAVAISWHLWGEGRDDVQPLEHHHCRIVSTPYDWAEDEEDA